MKKISILLALVAICLADPALAASAVVTSLSGTAQVQTGAAAPRGLRVGDEVAQGDTISTGGNSSVVLKFDDGQVAALTANSRMQISAYTYDPPRRSGNILLSLVVGGMRAITGLIGHSRPESVKFRAATATIGIRGSDGMIVTDGHEVAVTVSEGAFTLTFTAGGETIVILAGSGAFGTDNHITQGTAREVFDQLPVAFQRAFGGLEGLTQAINDAHPGEPRPGAGGESSQNTPGPNIPPGGTGGGSASSR
jgi:hypothetical protein